VRTVFDGPLLNFGLSPDGRFVAIASANRESATDQTPPFRIVPVGGGDWRAIGTELAPGFHQRGFAWSADSRFLFFSRLVLGKGMALWRVPVDGGPAQPTSILFPKQYLMRISVHPDGLLMTSTQLPELKYYVMRNIPPAAKR